ncbi:polyamine ABC transporter ATP-binding protein [Halobacteriales archaeon QS_5_70_15]|nr:MAG: polyamine ABC transporter ATP-binding protein [Halobacteriales archaeon QS_5_70_15]
MAILSLRNVRKEFGDLVAVDDASFAVEDGEFVSILGPSGSGKSTILRMIAGFETPTAGEIEIEGRNVVGVPPFERDVNMVFQSLALFPHLTVAENIAYGLKNRGVPEDQRADRIERMLEMVRLGGYGDRDPTELSGGEQQRVALARAVVNEPNIVLFDEPLASLDRKLRQHMQVELQRIQTETDITFLYVTHDQEVAMSVSDRMVLLNDGAIEQVGTAEELYRHPTSRFVADFIGDVNTIPGVVVARQDGQAIIEMGDSRFAVDSERIVDGGRDPIDVDDVAVCVRPEGVRISEAEAGSFALSGRIRNRIYRGDQVSYIVETDVGTILVNTTDERFQVGEEVYATWDEDGTHVFASEVAGGIQASGAGVGGA